MPKQPRDILRDALFKHVRLAVESQQLCVRLATPAL